MLLKGTQRYPESCDFQAILRRWSPLPPNLESSVLHSFAGVLANGRDTHPTQLGSLSIHPPSWVPVLATFLILSLEWGTSDPNSTQTVLNQSTTQSTHTQSGAPAAKCYKLAPACNAHSHSWAPGSCGPPPVYPQACLSYRFLSLDHCPHGGPSSPGSDWSPSFGRSSRPRG